MDFEGLRKTWDDLGKTDPLWAILAFPEKKGSKWKIEEFFQTGVKEADDLMEYVGSLSLDFPRRKALDFGCGVGRVTQALCLYFDEVWGVDIASSMIELADKHNRHDDKCHYYLNESDDLGVFSDNDFDFIYTNITLQHMDPRYSRKYIKEFLRILRPRGLLVFQIPSRLDYRRLRNWVKLTPLGPIYLKIKYRNQPYYEMHGIRREEVIEFLKESGATIVDIKEDKAAGKSWISYKYCVTK